MRDRLEFSSPFGLLGKMVNAVFLENYLRRFLLERNARLKQLAETDGWQKYLKPVAADQG